MNKKQDIWWFMENRQKQYTAAVEIVKKIDEGEDINILYGLLKSGKREIVEIVSLLVNETYIVIYCTSLNRKDMKDQFDEFKLYDIDTLCLTKPDQNLIPNYNEKNKYIIFFDEDYGDNKGQKFELFNESYRHNTSISWVFSTATPFSVLDALSSIDISNLSIIVADVSLEYNHVHNMKINEIHTEALTINKSGKKKEKKNLIGFTPSFEKIMIEWLSQNQYTKFIVRETEFQSDMMDKVKDKLRELQLRNNIKPKVNITLVDKDNSCDWMRDNWDGFELIIVKQTFTRGTETNIQPHLYGYYDHRSSSPLNTLLQALGRFCGYRKNNHINLFLSKEVANAVNANRYFEESMRNKIDWNTINNELHNKYGYGKLSNNLKSEKDSEYETKISVHDNYYLAQNRAIELGMPNTQYGKNSKISGNRRKNIAKDITDVAVISGKRAYIFHNDAPCTNPCDIFYNETDELKKIFSESYKKLMIQYPDSRGKYFLIERTKKQYSTISTNNTSAYANLM